MQRRSLVLSTCLVLLIAFASGTALAQYNLTNLVSNQIGGASHIDPLLVNAWGLAYGPGSPLWVSDQGSGWATLYDGRGNAKSLKVEIPTASGAGVGSPTGIVFNGSSDFVFQGWSAIFMFATLDGTISAWSFQVDPNNAFVTVDNSGAGAVYTGLAVTQKPSGNFLYAADVANGKVDMFDANFTMVGSFTDPTLPPNFTPFGINDINGQVYVTFADVTGGPGGFVDLFNEDGTFVKQLVSGAPLNQPWGLAVAPKNFGPLSNTLLVSNNTNAGAINGFNLSTGKFAGKIKDMNGKVIKIDQLWSIVFGGGTSNDGAKNELFFTAGPHNNLAGTLGSITVK